MKDPYSLLGLTREATAEEIKRAYRRLAKRLHPDLNPGNRAVEQQFKELSAAYELLSDPAQRARFDRGEIDGDGNERRRGFRASGRRAAETESFSFDGLFSDIFGRGRQAAGAAFGAEAAPATTLRLSFLEAALGTRRRVALADGREIEVAVPAGIDSGQTLRLRGARGSDTHLLIEVEAHPLFTRQGKDIHLELPVTLAEAVLGATVTVPTIHGPVAVRVPRGSNGGAVLRLKGKGIAAASAAPGDQYAKLRVMLPDPPDAELTRFLERWAAGHSYAVRGKLDAL